MQAFNETGERRQPMQQQQFGSYQPMQLPMQQQPDTSTVSHFGDAQYRPQVEQQPASFDPRAIAGDPQGFQQYMQQMQQREQQRPGSTMLPQQQQQQPQFNPYQQQRQQFNPYQRQNPYQQQRQQFNPYQQQRQQFNPYQRQQFNPYQQQGQGLADLMSMMGIRRSMPQPRMSMDMPQGSTDYGRNFGAERKYFTPEYTPVARAAPAPAPAPAPAIDNYWMNTWKDGGEV
jgi:hypothetical protein